MNESIIFLSRLFEWPVPLPLQIHNGKIVHSALAFLGFGPSKHWSPALVHPRLWCPRLWSTLGFGPLSIWSFLVFGPSWDLVLLQALDSRLLSQWALVPRGFGLLWTLVPPGLWTPWALVPRFWSPCRLCPLVYYPPGLWSPLDLVHQGIIPSGFRPWVLISAGFVPPWSLVPAEVWSPWCLVPLSFGLSTGFALLGFGSPRAFFSPV